MGMMDKIEDLVFSSRALASVEIVRDRIVLVKTYCTIEHLVDNECFLRTAHGTLYKIYGVQLQIKEYGDTYVKVEGKQITNFFIDARVGGEVNE